jgi:integrase
MANPPDPSRRRLPLPEWPATDRAAWEAAIAEGDVLDGRGPAAHWRAETRKTNIRHYGRYLGFLAWLERLQANQLPAQRVTPDLVRLYVIHLKAAVAPRTVVTSLVGLKVMILAMAPDHSWSWLKDVCNALNRTAKPSKDKRSRMRPIQEIYATALSAMDRLMEGPLARGAALAPSAYRNLFMVAFLAALPLRLKNFAGLEIGRHLIRETEAWRISIPGEEVKTGQPLEYELIASLEPYLQLYLERIRPQLLGNAGPSAHLWVGWGKPKLTDHSVNHCIMRCTKRLFDVAINPHLFRDCAATSLSLVSPSVARSAAPLLGHRSFETTERHYIRANQIDASRKLNDMLTSIKSSLK